MLFYSALPNHFKDIQNNWLLKFQKSINTKQQKLRELLEKQLWCQIDIFCRINNGHDVKWSDCREFLTQFPTYNTCRRVYSLI
jgi:hypothetical protein